MFKTGKTALVWSLALGGAFLAGCKEEDKMAPSGGGGAPTTLPTTRPGAGDMDRSMPTTRPGAETGLLPPGTLDAPDATVLPRLPGLPGVGEAETAGSRTGPLTGPTTLPTTGPAGIRLPGLPGVPGTPDVDNK